MEKLLDVGKKLYCNDFVTGQLSSAARLDTTHAAQPALSNIEARSCSDCVGCIHWCLLLLTCSRSDGLGAQMLERREKVLKITTGSSTLDQLLGGGIESAAITGQCQRPLRLSIMRSCAVDSSHLLLSCHGMVTEAFGDNAALTQPPRADSCGCPITAHLLCLPLVVIRECTVSYWQDAVGPHAVCDSPVAQRERWWQRQGSLHRHGRSTHPIPTQLLQHNPRNVL